MAVLNGPRRFLGVWAGCLFAALALAASVNFAVDPYAVFGTRAGLSPNKPAAIDHPFLSKVYLEERADPRTLLIGTSRVDIGLDPQSPAWSDADRPVFNLGMPGAGIGTLAHLLRHALSVSHPHLVVIGVGLDDFAVFPGPPGAADADPQTARLNVTADGGPNPARARARADDIVTALLSISATADSFGTLVPRLATTLSTVSPLGFNDAGDFRADTSTEGPFSVFVAKDRYKLARLLPWSRAQRFDTAPLAAMIADVTAAGAEARVFTYPNSSEDMTMFHALGADQTFDAWRADVTRVVTESRARGARATLWDFTGFSVYQTEPLPPPGSHAALRWYWDPNHFTAHLGDLVIARLSGGGDPGFGTVMDAAALPPAQARFDAAWADFNAGHPETLARVNAIYRETRGQFCAAPGACVP